MMSKNLYLIILITSFVACQQIKDSANAFMNRNSFETLVERFESVERTKYQKPDEVIKYIGNVKGQKIMDLGAGTGYFTFRLIESGAKVIAADVDDRFINYMQQKVDSLNLNNQIELRKVPYDSPELKPNEIDKFLIVNTYHHVDNRSNYFKKVKAGLKPNGEAIIIDFFKKKQKVGPPKRYCVSVNKVVEELKEAGFTEFEVEKELLEFQYIIRAK